MKLLSVSNLTLGYDHAVVARNLHFEVNEGDYLCIVGENGSGKTTLMKTLLGICDKVSGDVIFGNGITKNEIGYLPQQTIVQRDFPASVKEIVISGCQARLGFRPFYTKKEKELAAKNMEKLGITELADRCYRELSGGQQQRVLLARALCAAGKILLLDEPVSGLDPQITGEMYELISKLNVDGMTIIMISHDIQAAIRYASHILYMSDDIFFGTAGEFMASEKGKLFIEYEKLNTRRAV
ncbi:metal ABC transporter ATP-binding protein [Butyrivibrio sp. INlla16]|uniref:metal ABC transporter ATP-binding protein n=1 Tax=Butyrivibrio sp. INlla16 TaxID=1520807 RepID=UPI00088D6539|nr:ABC transporter ATP-binding protein [Butyrivibrio sp. INlla16]SDB08094.1 zinc transport system ATP-binding protein [Butyrivibrio sp. INlla16]